jgi:hypothetical protein
MIKEYENTLRTIILLVIGDRDDASFGVTSERITKWIEKREIEKKNKEIYKWKLDLYIIQIFMILVLLY